MHILPADEESKNLAHEILTLNELRYDEHFDDLNKDHGELEVCVARQKV